ncbi:MAG: protein kinase [Planctomycetota bacterium]|nr:protein kinase [Planctomycetota bacterium]
MPPSTDPPPEPTDPDHAGIPLDDDSFHSSELPIVSPRLREISEEDSLQTPRAGNSFGSFRLLRLIGRGGMGSVYEAQQDTPSRRVALKILGSHCWTNPTARQRFRREILSISSFQHDHIVRVFTAGEIDDIPYYAMELLEGQPLDQFLSEGHLPPRKACQIALQVASGLEYSHSRGIVHRDIKPSNLILTQRKTDEDHIVITDFGLAQDEFGEDLTATGQILGTPLYMAPEQVYGIRDQIGKKSDTYSLGATLYHLLTGRPPIDAKSFGELQSRLETQPFIPPSKILSSIPTDLDRICNHALSNNPKDRYPSTGEMARDLDRFLRGEAVCAPQVPSPHRTRNVIVALTLIGVLCGIGFQLLLSRTSQQDLDQKITTQDEKRLAQILRSKDQKRLALLQTDFNKISSRFYSRHIGHKQYQSALQDILLQLRVLITQSPNISGCHDLRGQILGQLGQPEQSEISWRKSIQIDPHALGTRIRLMRHLLHQVYDLRYLPLDGSPTRALERSRAMANALQDLYTQAPLLPDESRSIALETLTQIGHSVAFKDDLDTHTLCLQGLKQDLPPAVRADLEWIGGLSAQPPSEMRRGFEKAIELSPQHIHARFSLARFHHQQAVQSPTGTGRHLSKAREILDEIILLSPKRVWSFVERGTILLRLKNYPKALKDLNRAVELSPIYYAARLQRGIARRQTGDFLGSIEDLDTAIGAHPQETEAWLERARAYMELQKYKEAFHDFSRVLSMSPDHLEARAQRSILHNISGRKEEALLDANRYIQLAPKSSSGYRARGQAHLSMGGYLQAIQDFTQAIEVDTKPSAHDFSNRAVARWRINQIQEAFKDFSHSLKIDPSHSRSLLGRAGIFLQMSKNPGLKKADRTRLLQKALIDCRQFLKTPENRALPHKKGKDLLRRIQSHLNQR